MSIIDAAFETLKQKGYTDEQIEKLLVKLIVGAERTDKLERYLDELKDKM
ncbi:hypothetical protein [Priestia megaterium]